MSLGDTDIAYFEAKEYYGNLLAGMDKDMLPLDDVEGKAEGMAQFFWSSDVDVRMVKEFCAQHDFTEKAFFNACFAYVLTKFTGREKAFYATIHDDRSDAGSARAATLLEKTFPVLLTVEDKESIVAFVGRMGQQLSASMAHDAFSFVDIAHEYELTAELVFAYQGEVPAEENSGEKKDSASLPASDSPARLCIEVHILDGKAVFGCAYRSDCYSEELARSMLGSLAEAAKEFLVRERLADVSLLSKEAEAQLDRFNETEVPYDKSQTVVSLFRKAVQAYADRRAVVFDDEEYCYAEVDDLSEKDCVGAYANMMDTYPALTCGAAVYIVNEEMRFDLAGMNACFEKHRESHPC